MSKELATKKNNKPAEFSAESLIDGIKIKIRAEIPGMLTDDQWQDLIKKEIQSFFKSKQENVGSAYSPKMVESPSEFGEMVQEELKKIAAEYIAEQVRPLIKTTWDGQKQTITEELEQFVAKAAPDMLTQMMKNMAHQTLVQLSSNNGIRPY